MKQPKEKEQTVRIEKRDRRENRREGELMEFCNWDALAIAFVAVVTGWYLITRHKLKKEIKDLEDQLD